MEENRRTNIFSALDDEEPQQVKQVVHVAEAEPSSAPVMLPELDNADWADMADEDDDFYRGASGTIDTLDDTFIPGQIVSNLRVFEAVADRSSGPHLSTTRKRDRISSSTASSGSTASCNTRNQAC